jgi:hypothetical protein
VLNINRKRISQAKNIISILLQSRYTDTIHRSKEPNDLTVSVQNINIKTFQCSTVPEGLERAFTALQLATTVASVQQLLKVFGNEQKITLQNCTRKVPGSNRSRAIGYRD